MTTLAVGYNSRGSYVPDGDTGFHYDPGDQVIVTAGLQYMSEDWLLSVTGILTRETTSKLAGVEFFRPGTTFAILGQGVHKWSPQHATTASLYFNNTEKNAVLDFFTGALILLCHKLTRRAIVGRSIMRRRVMNLPIPSETREARFAAYVDAL
ncbi:hypothetical protein, partial [Microvirga tunisiensis]